MYLGKASEKANLLKHTWGERFVLAQDLALQAAFSRNASLDAGGVKCWPEFETSAQERLFQCKVQR